jgi:UDP-N-acetylmuramoyl-L-alanyl-D-glutamate--2,6-diaminopimelate ligase
MEVSSHALSQGRVNGVHFDVAMLTNLSRDHLDYHGDMERYASAKRKLFDWHQLKYVVLNLDDEFGVDLAQRLQDDDVEVVGYGLSDAALQLAERLGLRMVYGNLLEMTGQGLRLAIHSSWGAAQLDSALIGRFNAANLLGTLAVLLVSGIGLNDAVQCLSRLQPVPGRMQRVGDTRQPTVIVDYAHTPDALEKVLLALREVNSTAGSRLICVFGCGGDRDRGKRAMMGKIAERFSDRCIVTSDNPRSEEPLDIILDIVGGMSGTNHEIMVERAAAIHSAISRAQMNDTVLIAGKGHEAYQEINGVKHPFNDALIAQQALKASHAGASG